MENSLLVIFGKIEPKTLYQISCNLKNLPNKKLILSTTCMLKSHGNPDSPSLPLYHTMEGALIPGERGVIGNGEGGARLRGESIGGLVIAGTTESLYKERKQ